MELSSQRKGGQELETMIINYPFEELCCKGGQTAGREMCLKRVFCLCFKMEDTKICLYADENDLLKEEKLIIWKRGFKI